MGKTHKPPSREKYEANYPNWTVRMPKEWHVVTEVFLRESNLSRRQFMGIALKIQKIDFERVRWQGWNDGYSIGYGQGERVGSALGQKAGYENGYEVGFNEGDKQGYERGRIEGIAEGILQGCYQGDNEGYDRCLKDWRIWSFCPSCHGVLFIPPNSEIHDDIIGFLMSRGWGHYPYCPHHNPYF
ncbi:MAG: hypothetical protein JSW60_07980 [Thermoplasmatales archaeon]|nr:MAG: hypothetical protein JSW60_07980 [Thermoplasmatales archaeon]